MKRYSEALDSTPWSIAVVLVTRYFHWRRRSLKQSPGDLVEV